LPINDLLKELKDAHREKKEYMTK
jgi:hypothetical protein